MAMASAQTEMMRAPAAARRPLLDALRGLDRLPAVRQVGLIVALAAVVGLAVATVLWSQKPEYTLLYGHLGDSDTVAVLDTLANLGIEHRIDVGSGGVLVPRSQVHEARLRLAGEGLPRAEGSAQGYELLDQDPGLTFTQRSEDSRHQRALEGELARSVASLSMVQSARVHLALSKPSAFLRDNRRSSASVVVQLYQGKTLGENDIKGIVHLVAASVADLDPERVTVVDQRGRLLTPKNDPDELGFDATRFDFTRRVEKSYVDRVIDILAPVVGLDGVRAQVVATLDFTQAEHSEETFDPSSATIRGEHLQEQKSQTDPALGVPGSLTNQPPPAGSPNSPEAESRPQNESRSSTRNYEIDRRVSHTRLAPGVLQRLSVAVVIDHARTTDAKGASQNTPRSDEEIAHIRALVEQAVGFSAERGDTVAVINAPFVQPAALPEMEQPPVWEQPWLWQGLKGLIAPLALVVIGLMIFRPTIRTLASYPALPGPEGAPALAGPSGGGAGIGAAGQTAQDEGKLRQSVEETRLLVREDPARAAQVVSEWMGDQ